jgi:hypothetical protein
VGGLTMGGVGLQREPTPTLHDSRRSNNYDPSAPPLPTPHLNPKSCSRLCSSGLPAPPSTLSSNAAAIASRARRESVATVVGYHTIVRSVSRKVQRGAYSPSAVIWAVGLVGRWVGLGWSMLVAVDWLVPVGWQLFLQVAAVSYRQWRTDPTTYSRIQHQPTW